MLLSLLIRNFQSHEESFVEFSPGVTLITGTSNHGKTAILRALNWIINNRPLGDSFIRHDQECCDIILATDKGSVRRLRSKRENLYIVGPSESISFDPKVLNESCIQFTAMGSDVPKEVNDRLRISPINVQQQLDPYFLVLDSPGRVGSYFNSIIHLDEVEDVIDELTKRSRSEANKIKDLKEEEKKVDEYIVFYEKLDLDKFEKLLDRYDRARDLTATKKKEILEFNKLIRELKEIESTLVELPDITSVLEKSKVIPLEIEVIKKSLVHLQGLVEDYNRLNHSVLSLSSDSFSSIEKAEPLGKEISTLDKSLDDLFGLIEKFKKIEETSKELACEIGKASKLKQSFLEQLTVCPYCETNLSEEHKRILLDKEKVNV